MIQKYKLDEQETVILFDPVKQVYHFSTTYAPHIRKYVALGLENLDNLELDYKDEEKTVISGISFTIPADSNKFNMNPSPKPKRKISPERRKALIAQLDNLHTDGD